jgi:hypothetical protein
MLAYCSYQDECEAAEIGSEIYLSRDSLDVELIWGCGLTLLQHRIKPDDLMTMRKNFLRKNKQRVFGRALVDYTMEIEPSSHYAQNARLRVPPGN